MRPSAKMLFTCIVSVTLSAPPDITNCSLETMLLTVKDPVLNVICVSDGTSISTSSVVVGTRAAFVATSIQLLAVSHWPPASFTQRMVGWRVAAATVKVELTSAVPSGLFALSFTAAARVMKVYAPSISGG